MAKKKNEDGSIRFNEYYSGIYKERWESLKTSLLEEKETQVEIPGLKFPYYVDEASLMTARLLPINEGMNVLDMCAAPGGKTLVLATKLNGTGSLTSNDRSPDRRTRLRNSISECLLDNQKENIRVTGYDASSWGVYEQNMYDAILLDAPCSSERHVLMDPKHLSIWSPSRPKRLAILQYAMLSSALLAAKSGGYILYSTCSINPEENSGVISKLFKRHGEEIEEIAIDLDGESLEHGKLVLPDKCGGKGPMYACLIRKL